jgi:hypothetical protein
VKQFASVCLKGPAIQRYFWLKWVARHLWSTTLQKKTLQRPPKIFPPTPSNVSLWPFLSKKVIVWRTGTEKARF